MRLWAGKRQWWNDELGTPGRVAQLYLYQRDSGQITYMALVGLGFFYCKKRVQRLNLSSWGSPTFCGSILTRCYLLAHTRGQMLYLWDLCRHNTDVAGILLPDTDTTGCPPGYQCLSMTEPEGWGSPSCFQRLPPHAWGLGLLHSVTLPTSISQVKCSGELLHMSWANGVGARYAQGCLCEPRAGPTREIKENVRWFHESAGKLIKVNFPFPKNAVRKNCEEVLSSCFGKGPVSGRGYGERERQFVDLNSQIICIRGRKETQMHRNWPLTLECPMFCFPY